MGRKKIIAFANQKGGVGKTTAAVNTAAYLAKAGKKVLIVDTDPQGNATGGLGIKKRKIDVSVYDLIIGRGEAQKAVMETSVKGLSIIPSVMNLVGAELELVDEDRREYRLRDALAPIKDKYDYIIIDCPPSLGLISINSLVAADGVVIPMLCEYYSLEGLSQLTMSIKKINNYYNSELELIGILVNMYDGRLNLTFGVMSEIKKHFADKLFRTPIPRNIKLSEAPSYGIPIHLYDRFSKGSRAFEAFTQELILRCEK